MPLAALVGYVVKVARDRTRPDHVAYCELTDQLGLLADDVGGIIGRPGSLEKDCERCRSAYTRRRRVGEVAHELFPGEKFGSFSRLLTAISRSLRSLEDQLHDVTHDPDLIRQARAGVEVDVEEVRRELQRRTKRRVSLIVHGRRRGGKSD